MVKKEVESLLSAFPTLTIWADKGTHTAIVYITKPLRPCNDPYSKPADKNLADLSR